MKKIKNLGFIGVFVFLLLGSFLIRVYGSTGFKDVKDKDWFYNDMKYILDDGRNIIEGYPDNTFKANEKLSVEQFITMVVRAKGYNLGAKENERWSKPYIDMALDLKYIKANDFIEYDVPITRAEMARIVVNSVENITGPYEYRDSKKIISHINDYDFIGNGFKDACVKAYDIGIITGYTDGSFKPENKLTRAEGTTIIRRLIDMKARKIINIDGIKPYVYNPNPNIPQELYEYDLRRNKRDNWLGTNIWMTDRYGIDKITEFMNIGKGYVETFYNVDYKTINKDDFKKKIQWYFMPGTQWIGDDRIMRPMEEFFNYWVDMVKEKEIQWEMKFITDPSLVYSDGKTVIRGMAIYTIKSCNDIKWLQNFTRFAQGAEVGKTYERVVEIEIINMALLDGWEHAERVVSDEYFTTLPKEVSK